MMYYALNRRSAGVRTLCGHQVVAQQQQQQHHHKVRGERAKVASLFGSRRRRFGDVGVGPKTFARAHTQRVVG